MSQSADVIVHEFEKNQQEQVRVMLRHYQGRDLIDLRIYYRTQGGEVKPSPRGVTVDQRLLDELEAGVRAARAAIEARRA